MCEGEVDNHRQAGRETNALLSFFSEKLMTTIESAAGWWQDLLVPLEHENTPASGVFCIRSLATTWAVC